KPRRVASWTTGRWRAPAGRRPWSASACCAPATAVPWTPSPSGIQTAGNWCQDRFPFPKLLDSPFGGSHTRPALKGEVPVYREIFVPVDNSPHSDWAVDRAIELCRQADGRVTGNHVYAARLHDVRFRQLETGLPARFQTPEEIKKQRKIHDKLIEKGLQLIADSFLDQLASGATRPVCDSRASCSKASITKRSR